MRAPALLLCCLALLGLTGCPEEACVDCEVPCEDPPAPFMPPMPGILLTGRQSEVVIQNARIGTCRGVAVSETSQVTAELTDPDGKLIAQETFDESVALAHFGFTVQRPGLHHFLASFEPPGALLQFALDAAIDRSATAPLLTRPGSCVSLERTRSGTWVCDSAISRGDFLLEQFTGARLAVAEDVVWVVTAAQVLRYVDTGTGLTLTGSLEHGQGAVESLLPSVDELVVLHDSHLMRYTASGGQLQASAPARWSHVGISLGSTLDPRGILLRDGDQLALITAIRPPADSMLQLCAYQLTAGGPMRTAQPCQELPGSLAGFEPNVLWTKVQPVGTSDFSIHRWLWGTSGLVEQTSVFLSFRLQLVVQPFQRTTVVPVVRSLGFTFPREIPSLHAVVTWSPQWRSLVLEHMDAELASHSASPSLYWGSLPSGPQNPRTRIRLR